MKPIKAWAVTLEKGGKILSLGPRLLIFSSRELAEESRLPDEKLIRVEIREVEK